MAAIAEITLKAEDDFEEWRDAARKLLVAGIAPDRVMFSVAGSGDPSDLFAARCDLASLPSPAVPVDPKVPRAFLQYARQAALHSSPARHGLLYRLLWRLQTSPRLIDDAADADVRQLIDLAKAVRRDSHKMHAFVRFRAVIDPQTQAERFVAWFEPSHHILRANASFFVNRFANMHWSILTPRGSLHWDGETLCEGPPATRADAPAGDDAEDLWKRYYASIFNPARLKVGAMLKEMPRRYWQNLPEASLIPSLVATAQSREAAMVEQGQSLFDTPRPATLDDVAASIAACRRCPIGCNGTNAVAGEGCETATLMIVGEQPGDCEEAAGRPFIGPAGTLLREHLMAAQIDTSRAWLTNAVKHFKHLPQPHGKRRLHQTPSPREIDICRWWLESERLIVKPRIVLALGASAARGLLGKTVSVEQARRAPIDLPDGSTLFVTTHPSYLLRLDGPARGEQSRRFGADLERVRDRVRQVEETQCIA